METKWTKRWTKWSIEKKQSRNKYGQAWYKRNPEHAKELAYNRNLRMRYGMTRDEYDSMLKSQGGRCAVCVEKPKVKKHRGLIVDHNHETGKVRALLCKRCNTGIGYIEDFRLLSAAQEYLALHA